ncbi:MAG: hypothetical protein WC477_06225 [Patescibacteria group bacterium]
MCKKDKRSKKQNIKALQRSIRKFGDSDGKRSETLKELRASK